MGLRGTRGVRAGGLLRNAGRWGPGPLVAFLFFAGTLVPALGFFNVYPMRYSFVADHFQYLASLGPIVLGAALVAGAWRRWTQPDIARTARERPVGLTVFPGGPRLAGWLLTCVILSVLAWMNWQQQRAYKSAETLWSDVLSKNPQSGIAHFHLGKIRAAQGRIARRRRNFATPSGSRPTTPSRTSSTPCWRTA